MYNPTHKLSDAPVDPEEHIDWLIKLIDDIRDGWELAEEEEELEKVYEILYHLRDDYIWRLSPLVTGI